MKTRWISNKTVKIGGIYSSLEEAFEFCWSSFADEHNTLVKSTRRNVKLNKFGCGTSWLPDILIFKHWFTSSVWYFCRWVADVPPRETSPAAKSEAKRLFSQATTHFLPVRSKYLFTLTYLICDDPVSRWAQRSFAPSQKSRRNHRSFVWTDVLSSMVFVSVQELSGTASKESSVQ